MNTKLTLSMDDSLIAQMKATLKKENTSLSQWTEDMYRAYLAIHESEQKGSPKKKYPEVDALRGILKNVSKEDIRQAKGEYLKKKHHLS